MVSLSILFQNTVYRISCFHLMLFICIVCFIIISGLEMHLHRLPKIWSEIYYLMKNIEWMEGVSIKSDQFHVTWICILLFMAHQCFNVVKLKFCAQWPWTVYTLLRYRSKQVFCWTSILWSCDLAITCKSFGVSTRIRNWNGVLIRAKASCQWILLRNNPKKASVIKYWQKFLKKGLKNFPNISKDVAFFASCCA